MEVPDLLIMFVRYPRIGAVKTRMTQQEPLHIHYLLMKPLSCTKRF